jgi:hypothetical protein
LAKPISDFGFFHLTTFIEHSHVLPIPLTLAPIRLVLAEPSFPYGSDGNFTLRVHCQQAVLLLRVLLMEQQVRIFFSFLSNNRLGRFMSQSHQVECRTRQGRFSWN